MSFDEFRILDATTVAELRAMNGGNMPHVATVTFVPLTGARVGGALVNRTPTTLLDNAPCRLTPRKRFDLEVLSIGQQMRAPQLWWLSFDPSVELPDGAVAVVTGTHDDNTSWTRTVRIGAPSNSRMFEIGARYAAEDVTPSGR